MLTFAVQIRIVQDSCEVENSARRVIGAINRSISAGHWCHALHLHHVKGAQSQNWDGFHDGFHRGLVVP